MSTEIVFSSISLVISILALTITGFLGFKQLKKSEESNSLPLIIDMIREFRNREFKAHLDFINNDLRKFPKEMGYNKLNKIARNHVKTASHFFNHISFIVLNGIVNEDLVIEYMGSTMKKAWDKLYPYLQVERKNRTEDPEEDYYQHHFEEMVNRINEKMYSQLEKPPS